MTYVFSQLCWWLLAALIIGLATGWFTFARDAKEWKLGWLKLGLLAFVIGGIVAVLKLLPNKPGFWLEAALFTFASFIIGCFLGSWIRGLLCPAASVVAPLLDTTGYPGAKPLGIAMPQGGADDLKLIRGVGPKNEKILNDLGVYRFCQIGQWSEANAAWVGHHIAFPGRIEREQWIQQGKLLCAGIETDYAKAVRNGSIVIDDKADTALSDAEIADVKQHLPQFAASVADEDKHQGFRPLGLAAARNGQPDDLKLIKGIGPQNEGLLHGLGIWHFDQIASWTAEHASWVGSYLAFPGRIEREEWVDQAKILAKGGSTEFAERVKAGEVPTSVLDGTQGQDNILKPVENP